MSQVLPPPPPKLQFDDGLRTAATGSHMNDTDTATSEAFPENPRLKSAAATGTTSNNVYEYYEVERLIAEIHHIATTVISTSSKQQQPVRVAIQLPDELLMDAMEICHEFERAFHHHDNNVVQHEYQVYVLGDTTYAPCCPDRIASEHLQSHILIHYGHACFSNIHRPHDPTHSHHHHHHHHHHTSIPPPSSQPPQPQPQYPIVLYSFGKQMISVPQCAQDVRQELYRQLGTTNGHPPQNILLLYEVQYAHAMKDLRTMLQTTPVPPPITTTSTTTDHDDANRFELRIKMGRIPQQNDIVNEAPLSTSSTSSSFRPPTSTNRNTIVDEHHPNCCRNDIAITTQSQLVTPRSCCRDTSLSNDGDHQDDHPINNNDIPLTSTETVMSTTSPPHLEFSTNNPSNGTRSTTTSKNAINQQYHHIMVGGLELPHPFSSSHNFNHTDDDEWVCQNHEDTGSFDNKTEDTINYIVLYIGNVTSRPFLNVVLRFLSSSNVTRMDRHNNNKAPPQQYHLSSIWAWTPTTISLTDHVTKTENPSCGRLCTDVLENSKVFHKILQRRYYLIQKAKQCTTFGIIVAHMTPNIQSFVQSIQIYLDQQQNKDRTISHYTFVVGKINPTKLANFPEIECFILVACPEHALLQNERELYPIPIITPYELLVAFGSGNYHKNSNIEWGDTPYSTHPNDYWALSFAVADLSMSERGIVNHDGDVGDDDNSDDDAPYFSLVTGQYETRTKSATAEASTASTESALVSSKEDIKAGNGVTTLSTRIDGTIVQYGTGKSTSAAADFFKHREYQGLVMMTPYEGHQRDQGNGDNIDDKEVDGSNGNTIGDIQPAVLGRSGIASNYGNR